jgi:photosystem II stability/assembly factor-like uncharacterized protein
MIGFFNKSEGLLLGSRGEILYTSNAGKNWNNILSNTFSSLVDLAVTPSKKNFIVGYNRAILLN